MAVQQQEQHNDDDDVDVVPRTFRALVGTADRKFARARDLPSYGRANENHHYLPKVFKAYMKLWKYQQEHRSKLVDSGLKRWEIGEIASRIGQLYFNQYMRTSEARYLVEAFVFYEAILNRQYFEEVKDVRVKFKELRFYARFLLLSLVLNRTEMVRLLLDRLRAVIDDCRSNFKGTNFKEWKLVVHEITRFMEIDNASENARPLRYSVSFDSHPTSRPYVARFHAKKVLKFKDALLASYHRNEVKFAELTLDIYRMIQCLEWEPSGSFCQKRNVESVPLKRSVEKYENGSAADHSGASGLIDINLVADLTDPTLPSNPRKAILSRPSVTHLLAVMATICEELPPESIMLIYLSASGNAGKGYVSQTDNSAESRKSSQNRVFSRTSSERDSSASESYRNGKWDSNDCQDNYLLLGPRGTGGSNAFYPSDIIPFTRRPLFLIIDSDCSHSFKVLHRAEMGEPVALLLSPLKPAFKSLSKVETTRNGSQFTFFLAAPLQAFCQMVDLTSADIDADVYSDAEEMLSHVLAEWEVILCKSNSLDVVWAQVLSDPFLRRLILRFIFCWSVLSMFCTSKDKEQYQPVCLPHLPDTVSPHSEVVHSAVVKLANHLKVADYFRFDLCN